MDIRLRFERAHLSGLEALDRRRALGLTDGDTLDFSHDCVTTPVVVDEAFARAWFTPKQTTSYAIVRQEMFAKGDIELTPYDYSTFAELSPERIKELYIAVRFTACREQVERLQQEVDTLKAKADKLQEA